MPLYEYQCDKCGGVFELIEKFSDPPKTVHEQCGGAVHRLVSTSALQFKGSGWYVNDYAKSGSKPATEGGKAEAKSGESKSSSDSSSSSKSSDSGTSSTPAASTTPASKDSAGGTSKS
jgi:putative FmdB family regulatory protein